VNQKYTNK